MSASALVLALSAAVVLRGQSAPSEIQSPAEPALAGVAEPPVTAVYVNFSDLARQEAALGAARPSAEEATHEHGVSPLWRDDRPVADTPAAHDALPSPDVPSPAPTLTFGSQDDTGFIPPDTQGAVGPRHVMTTLNGGYRIHDKATGGVLNSLSMASFWAATGASSPFDPKATYDPYNNRWILSGVSNARLTTSSVLLGISTTDDPTGGWYLYRFVACASACGATGSEWWADYPELGFNTNWVAISANMFHNSTNLFQESRLWVVNYPVARGGTAPFTVFTALADFTIVPTPTYSPTEPTLYTVTHAFGSGAAYRLSTITGTAGAPVYTRGAQRSHTLLSGWSEAYTLGTDATPQAPEPGTGLVHGVDTGDSRIMNAVFRGGAIYYAQTVALPLSAPTHTAAQWVKLSTAGTDLDAGRVEDPTATSTNGGRWYTYPSIAVNASGDVLLGFGVFGSSIYPSGGYAYRAASDAPGTMRDVVTFVAGADFYYKTYSGTRNRWGDYTATQVDPSDDLSFWTIQESSKVRVGSGNGSGRWTTTWAKIRIGARRRTRDGDFDGDGRADITVYRPSNGTWYTLRSSGGATGTGWGNSTDIPVPGDYDGDGRIDVAVFRPSNGTWYIVNSGGGTTGTAWGNSADIPVPGDYDGDGRTDVAVYRPSNGTWYIVRSSAGVATTSWGNSTDVPVAGDYDGDGRTDVAVFRPSNGTWYVVNSGGGTTGTAWGNSSDRPVPGDYNGDGRTDVAVFRPSNGTWYVLYSGGGSAGTAWGNSADTLVPGDFDGDGRTDIAVFRPSNGTWYIINSSTGIPTGTPWGNSSDLPILSR